MARSKAQELQPPKGFVASAANLPTVKANEAGKAQGWQNRAWTFFDEVSELRYIANWIGNVMGRAELHAARREGNQLVPADSGPAREAMDQLYGGLQGQSEMLDALGLNGTVAGEGYIVYRAATEKWYVLATGKVTQDGQGTVNMTIEEQRVQKMDGDLVIRMWTPHPQNSVIADAPTRSNLNTLAQIQGYDQHIAAQLDSRLSGNGILFIPNEVEFAAPNEEDPESTSQNSAQNFMAMLHRTMQASKQGQGTAVAQVPIVAAVPGEFVEKIQHLTFWSDLDEKVIDMRLAAIRRFAIGMDVPIEVLLGNADANHWNAWLSDESAIKVHIEPRLSIVNHALTQAYLRPSLIGTALEGDVENWFVISDTSQIRVRPNRSQDALELHDRGLIKNSTVLRETGFRDEDAMENDEFEQWILRRITQGASTPELVESALRLLGVNVQVAPSDGGGLDDATRPPTSNELPDRSPPEQDPALAAACEVLVYRALERAGNKLKNRTRDPGPASKAYLRIDKSLLGDATELLDGSWECASEVLANFDIDPQAVVNTLDFYVRGLLANQQPHSPKTLSLLIQHWDHSTPAMVASGG